MHVQKEKTKRKGMEIKTFDLSVFGTSKNEQTPQNTYTYTHTKNCVFLVISSEIKEQSRTVIVNK